MFWNLFRPAIRNLARNKYFTVINVVGLSLGLASCMLMLLYARDEFSYDRFHKKRDQIYQLTCDRVEKEGSEEKFAIAAMVQGPAFKREIPEIKEFVRVDNQQLVIKKENNILSEEISWVDANFFSVFSFRLLYGDPQKPFPDLHSVVLTDEMAKKYFDNAEALGKTLEIGINGKFETFIVSGIAGVPPGNSSIQFHFLLPFNYLEQESPDNGWMWVSYPTYFLMDPDANLPGVKAKMEKVYRTQARSEIEMNHRGGYDTKFIWGLMPLVKMHLTGEYERVAGASDPVYSYILTAVALFVLLIACVNFINLTLAQSLKRGKEIGVRKVIGSSRGQLIAQFLGESSGLCLLSFLLAMLLTGAFLPVFNEIAGKRIGLGTIFDWRLITGIVFLFLLTAFLAGFYPALVLSKAKPLESLLDRRTRGGKDYLTKALVVGQFTLATFLVIVTFFIYAQFNYLVNSNLGYRDKDLVEFVAGKAIMNRPLMDLIRTEYARIPGVERCSYRNVGKFGGKTKAGGREFPAVYDRIDVNYLAVLGVTILSGRNFSPSFPTDSFTSVLVNESFAKEAGWKDPIGKSVDFMNLPG